MNRGERARLYKQVAELAAEGFGAVNIARELQQPFGDVVACMQQLRIKTRAETGETTAELISKEAACLDAVQEAMIELVGEVDIKTRMDATALVIRASESKRKLFGLDGLKNVGGKAMELSPENIAAKVRERFQGNVGSGANASRKAK
jgi:hypothetical protein